MSLQLNDVCNVQTFLTKVSYGNAVKSLILYPGITLKEVHDTLRVSFALGSSCTIVGLKENNHGLHFPLSILALDPSRFAVEHHDEEQSYSLLISMNEEDDANEQDANEQDANVENTEITKHKTSSSIIIIITFLYRTKCSLGFR